jgi:hypothetical protein
METLGALGRKDSLLTHEEVAHGARDDCDAEDEGRLAGEVHGAVRSEPRVRSQEHMCRMMLRVASSPYRGKLCAAIPRQALRSRTEASVFASAKAVAG